MCRKTGLHLISFILFLSCVTPTFSQQYEGTGTPEWLQISLEHRTRYEHLTNPFRLNVSGTEKHFPLRTRLLLEVGEHNRPVRFLLEFQDSRVLYEKENLYSTIANINNRDFLQAQLQFQSDRFPLKNLKSQLIVGRFTLNLGRRRLVARNNMRNTTNTFDGFSWTLTNSGHWTLQTFLTRPVIIDPYSLDSSSRRYFWGANFESSQFQDYRTDVYYFGLHDVESSENRQRHATFGGRFYKMPALGEIDYEVESAVQFGENGLEEHTAWLFHGEMGYRFNASWQPRLSLHFDYASGDSDPGDRKSNRFHTLYGARGFEFSPTGIYGPFYRSNIHTPGIKIELNPLKNLSISTAYRAYRLAQARDTWVGSGLQDEAGNSGKSLGQNLDIRIWWKICRLITLESGYALFVKGSYLDLVPDGPGMQNSNYFFIATEFKAQLLPL